MGNSEVGHLNLGAGAVVKQDLTRIDEAAEEGTLAENEVLRQAFEAGKESRVHLIGLVSEGGVHSAMRHLKALIELGAKLGVERPRDPRLHRRPRHAAEGAAPATSERSRAGCADAGAGRIGSVIGRYYAMDRDKRWGARPAGVRPARPRRRAASRRQRPRKPAEDAYDRERDRRVHHRHDRRRRGADPPRRQRAGVQLPPRPDARDHARARRPGVRRGRPQRAPPVEHYTCMTEYNEDWSFPVAFPPASPDGHAREHARRDRREAAARRRDREVPARDVLLQRRRGARLRRRAARAGAVPA